MVATNSTFLTRLRGYGAPPAILESYRAWRIARGDRSTHWIC